MFHLATTNPNTLHFLKNTKLCDRVSVRQSLQPYNELYLVGAIAYLTINVETIDQYLESRILREH